MKSKLENDSFHIIKTISGEISLDFTSQNISKKFKLIKPKNMRRKKRRKLMIKEQKNIIKKRESQLESIIANKIKKKFIPLPLINKEIDNIEKKHQFPSSKLYVINNNSFSYINVNNILKKETIYQQTDNIKEKNNNLNLKKVENIIVYYFKNNFECKYHTNNRYIAYCSKCQINLCQKCLTNELNHIEHKIFFYKDIMPSKIQIKYYQTLFLFSRYYLQRIRDIIIGIYYDLSELYKAEKNKDNKQYIKNILNKLKIQYKIFYRKNYYQLIFAKRIISIICYWKDLQCINYQIIKNLSDLKINSVKIPDLYDQHITNKARIMIEFMQYNSNNILKSSWASLPNIIYNYKNSENDKKSVDPIDIEKFKSFSDVFVKNPGVIYKPKKEDQYNNDINIIINSKIKNIQVKENNNKEIIYTSNKNKKKNIIDDTNNENEDDITISNNLINIDNKKLKNRNNSIKIIEKGDNILNNLDSNLIKKYITENLPLPSTEEVEFKKDVEYLYYDKNVQKKINCKYHGEFKKNTLIRHGRGLFIWEDGEYYLGHWVNDKREGKGKNYYANGDIYEGEYRNGKKEGKGIYKWNNGDRYEGDWRNDMKEGEGKYKCNNGDKYIGLFKMDKIEGNGLYIWANKNTYKGQFKNNEIEGKGILNYICSNANKEMKDIHSKLSNKKNREKHGTNNNNPNNDKQYVEIFTCDRSTNKINNSKYENSDINTNYK